MHTIETNHRFIELRARGWSFARVAAELRVNQNSLVSWQRKFRQEIADLKAVELEALQERLLASHEDELTRLAGHLNRVEAVLAGRKLEYVSTEFLFSLAATLRAQIRRQRVATEISELPAGGLPEDASPASPAPAA